MPGPCLVILTSCHLLEEDAKNIPSGALVSTLISMKKIFNSNNLDFNFGTVSARKPILDYENDDRNRDWVQTNSDKFDNLVNLEEARPNDFSAVFVPNMLGLLREVKENQSVFNNILKEFFLLKKPIATTGYGLAVFHDVTDEVGEWALRGYNVTGTSLGEDFRNEYLTNLPFTLETHMRERGANFVSSKSYGDPCVTIDRSIISGQNEQSSKLVLKNLALLLLDSSLS